MVGTGSGSSCTCMALDRIFGADLPESFPTAVSVAAVACRDKRIGTDSQMFMGKLRERREGKIHSRNHCLSCALKHSTIPSAMCEANE